MPPTPSDPFPNLEVSLLNLLLYIRHGEGSASDVAFDLASRLRSYTMTQREQETAFDQALADFRISFDNFKTRLANVLDGLSTTLVSIQNKLDTALADQIDLTDEKATVQGFQNEVESLTSSLPTPATPNLPSEPPAPKPPPSDNTGTAEPAAAPEDAPRSSQTRSTGTTSKR